MYELVSANQADATNHLSARAVCRVPNVSPSGYYDWQHRAPSARRLDNLALTEAIRKAHNESDHTYRMPRVRAEHRELGYSVTRKRIPRLMRNARIYGVSRPRGFTVTAKRDRGQRPAPDLVNRQFRAGACDQLWVAHLTYIPTWTGFLYLAVVIDAFSRKVVDWWMGERMTADLVLAALNMALHRCKPDLVIRHSDQGRQYTSIALSCRCKEMGIRPSMGTVGDAYDNAVAESFFASLECELINRRSWKGQAEAGTAISRGLKVGTTRGGITRR